MTSTPAFKLLNFIFATCLLAFLFFQTGKLIWGLEVSNKTILYPIPDNDLLCHGTKSYSSAFHNISFFFHWRILGVFVLFFSFLPSTATYMQFYLKNDCYFCGMKDEKREKETPKKKKKGREREQDLSLKRVENNANLCITKLNQTR